MKKFCMILLAALLLTGCTEPKTFETMSDVYDEVPTPAPRQVMLTLPQDAAMTTMTDEAGNSIYLCDGYSIMVQTLPAGDLDGTLQAVSGFDREHFQMMEREEDDYHRYECVWSAVGEGEDQVCRAMILDDGNYHYVLTVMGGASVAGQLTDTWQELFHSFSVGQ